MGKGRWTDDLAPRCQFRRDHFGFQANLGAGAASCDSVLSFSFGGMSGLGNENPYFLSFYHDGESTEIHGNPKLRSAVARDSPFSRSPTLGVCAPFRSSKRPGSSHSVVGGNLSLRHGPPSPLLLQPSRRIRRAKILCANGPGNLLGRVPHALHHPIPSSALGSSWAHQCTVVVVPHSAPAGL